jgi:preprotein translocase subunit SecD
MVTTLALALALTYSGPPVPVKPAKSSPRAAVFELRLAYGDAGPARHEYPSPPGTYPLPKPGDVIYVADAVVLSTKDLSNVNLVLEGDDHGVELHVKPEAARTLAAATGDHIGQRIALFVDGQLYSAPSLLSQLSDVIWLNGAFTDNQLTDLARRINAELAK